MAAFTRCQWLEIDASGTTGQLRRKVIVPESNRIIAQAHETGNLLKK
jgi:hypothetical protein